MLAPLVRWATLEDNKCSCLICLPNDCIPTNHLPIVASFKMCGHPLLCDGSRRRLIKRLNKIECRHLVEKAKDDQIHRPWGEFSEKQQQLEDDGIELVAGSELM
jgi:hypothetical protein